MGSMFHMGGNIIGMMGYTELVPASFQEVYDQDIAQGWGFVTKQGNNQFYINASLWMLSGYFTDTKKHAEFAAGRYFQPGAGTFLRLGEADNVSARTGKNGCCLLFHPGEGLTVFNQGIASGLELYNTQIILESGGNRYGAISLAANDSYTFRVWGSRFRGGFETKIQGSYADGKYALARTDIEDFVYGLELVGSLSSTFITETRIINCGDSIYFFQVSGVTVYNLKFIDNDFVAFFSSSSGTYDFINFESDGWAFRNIGLCTVNRQYTFNLKVTDKNGNNINGATVKIWDKDDVLVVNTTTASGAIAEQTITRGYYDLAHGNTLQDKSPHTIQISKAGYQTYKNKFTMDKIDWTVRLIRQAVNVDAEVLA